MVIEDITGIICQLRETAFPAIENLIKKYGADNPSKLFSADYKPFFIGNIKIKNPVISAPMAGISDNTYRIFARYFGSSLLYSEMITSYGLFYGHEKSIKMTYATEFERPFTLQLFGSKPEIIASAAQMLEEKSEIIDINMGCPVPKVVKTGSGGALLRDEDLIRQIIKKVKQTIKKPLTVKLRLGWDFNSINIEKTALIAESEGADAIAVHARTVRQGYSGNAEYSHLRDLKKKLKIPVIISGDIDNPFKAYKLLNDTNCEGIMIGRAARGNPWIFAAILIGIILLDRNLFDENGADLEKKFKKDIDYFLNNDIKVKILILYLKSLIHFMGEEKAVKEFRKILAWAFRGIRNINDIKKDFFEINNFKEAEKIMDSLIGM